MEYAVLRPGYEISRVIRGGWQLAGGHGAVERSAAVEDLMASAEAGITGYVITNQRAMYNRTHGMSVWWATARSTSS